LGDLRTILHKEAKHLDMGIGKKCLPKLQINLDFEELLPRQFSGLSGKTNLLKCCLAYLSSSSLGNNFEADAEDTDKIQNAKHPSYSWADGRRLPTTFGVCIFGWKISEAK